MNERIKELADQAGFSLWTDEAWKPEGAIIDWSCNYDLELEKFAELIVRECLNQIDKIRDACDADDEVQQALGVVWAGLAIAKHFGVEHE